MSSLLTAIDSFFQPHNQRLKDAFTNTVDSGFFGPEDVKHRILSLKDTLNRSDLLLLSNKIASYDRNLSGRDILCLNAGNLPMAGVEDLVTVILTGGTWRGKISRKDPWLLQAFVEELAEAGITDIYSSTDITRFTNLKADALVFSGSAQSKKKVLKTVDTLKLVKASAGRLVRTAWYSLACIEDDSRETMMALVEAVFRYGGRGCRSVAAVIAPFSLNEIKCELTDYIEQFWLHNPQHIKPPESLFHRYAYNKSLERPQAWLDDFLIEETRILPVEEFVLHWIRGGRGDIKSFIDDYGNGLQTVYVSGMDNELPGVNIDIEPLFRAQKPVVYWRPDGTDTVKWLFENIRS